MGGYGGHGYYLDPILSAVNHLKQSARAPCYAVAHGQHVSPDSPQLSTPGP